MTSMAQVRRRILAVGLSVVAIAAFATSAHATDAPVPAIDPTTAVTVDAEPYPGSEDAVAASDVDTLAGWLNVPYNWTAPTVCVAAYELDLVTILDSHCGEPGSLFTIEGMTPDESYAFRFVDAGTISSAWENYSGRQVWLGNVSHPYDSIALYIPAPGQWWVDVYFFEDVIAGHQFYWDISWMGSAGISTGYDDGTYRPTLSVTRQAMAAFLFRLLGDDAYTPPAESSFVDVSTSHPFYREVSWMAEEGISTGWDDGTFRPGDKVSRQAMSAFLYRIGAPLNYTPPATSPFTDVSLTHPFYKEIAWMADAEISTGYEGNTYRPAAAVSRQAMSAFLYRLVEYFAAD